MGLTKLIFVALFLPVLGASQSDLTNEKIIQGIKIYNDINDSCKFFYEPKPLEMVLDRNDGTPSFSFTRVRYTGMHNSGNNGEVLDFGDMQFEVQIPPYLSSEIELLKSEITKEMNCKTPELNPLLLYDIEIVLGIPVDNEAVLIEGGYLTDEEHSSIWSNKKFSLNLDRTQTLLFWNLLQEEKPIIDIHYKYLSKNVKTENDLIEQNQKLIVDTMVIIYSNTLQLDVNFKNNEKIKSIDLNQQGLWISYPLLDVLCFDFRKNVTNDLFRRRVEVQAIGFSTKLKEYVYAKADFGIRNPGKVAHELLFDEPVRMDLPFHYRITDTFIDGEKNISPWMLNKNWTYIDITKN